MTASSAELPPVSFMILAFSETWTWQGSAVVKSNDSLIIGLLANGEGRCKPSEEREYPTGTVELGLVWFPTGSLSIPTSIKTTPILFRSQDAVPLHHITRLGSADAEGSRHLDFVTIRRRGLVKRFSSWQNISHLILS